MLGSIANAKIETIVFMAINGITERLRFTIWAIACCFGLGLWLWNGDGCPLAIFTEDCFNACQDEPNTLPYAKTAGEKAMKAHMLNTLNDGTSIEVRITATTPTNIIQLSVKTT